MVSNIQKLILGIKIRQMRMERGWNFDAMSRAAGMSGSYLNEIEKGKKYPQAETFEKLSAAFEVSVEQLQSPVLSKNLAPISELLQSNFLTELPLEKFGIDLSQIVDMMFKAPERVNAFISAMLEIARNYSLREENFYLAALRAYQEMRMNYFEEIEQKASDFLQHNALSDTGGLQSNELREILLNKFNYKINEEKLAKTPELQHFRSLFIPKKRKLYLNGNLSEAQKRFQLAKEAGFCALQIKNRPEAADFLKINSFDEVFSNYQAAYFAVAVLIPQAEFVKDVRHFFEQKTWNPQTIENLCDKYGVTPEVLFQRFNVLSTEFGLHKVFFLRLIHNTEKNSFDIDKELHLNRRHQPHASGLNEHYCRRWVSVELSQKLYASSESSPNQIVSAVQKAVFSDTGEEYLCFGVAKHGFPTANRLVSIMLGIQIDEDARRTIQFCGDENIPKTTVGVTCERCRVQDCVVRANEPIVLQKRAARKNIGEAILKLK